jgi:hypothetical protein
VSATLAYDIGAISPSACFGAPAAADAPVREALRRYEPILHDLNTDEYNLRRFRSAAFHFIPLLLSLPIDLRRATMLEIGCGRGLKGLAWGDLLGRYIGIDLAPSEIDLGRALRARAGRAQDELILGDAAAILRREKRFAPSDIHILMLYAVLEHLTPSERIDILAFAKECYDAGSLVLIAETPNRLIPFDHHSAHKHFLQMLPDELALRHLQRFRDHPLKNLLAATPDYAPIALYRSGRGMSYHDFELDFCDGPLNLHLAADGWHPALLDLQPPIRAEIDLQSYFDDNAIPAPRAFSRAWLDLLLSASAQPIARTVRLWPPLAATAQCHELRQFWQLDTYLPRSQRDPLIFELPALPPGAHAMLLLHADDHSAGIELRLDGQPFRAIRAAELSAVRPPTWHQRHALVLDLPNSPCTLTLRPLSTHADPAAAMPTSGVLLDVP